MKFTALLNVLMKNLGIADPVLKLSKILFQLFKKVLFFHDLSDLNDGNIIN
jgi:hypothetical protein